VQSARTSGDRTGGSRSSVSCCRSNLFADGRRITNVIPMPVDDTATKANAGALFKPQGAGPFPAVVYMVGCYGLRSSHAS
jgi:hypothetical protein